MLKIRKRCGVIFETLRYLKGTKTMKLIYNSTSDGSFEGFCDAEWINDIDNRHSITGYVKKLCEEGNWTFRLVAWNCRKPSTVALSATLQFQQSLRKLFDGKVFEKNC